MGGAECVYSLWGRNGWLRESRALPRQRDRHLVEARCADVGARLGTSRLGDYGWVVLGPVGALVSWQVGHAGVWVGPDDILIVHPVFGKRRLRRADIDRFVVRQFNQWMIAWVITRTGDEIPCQGISSGRKRTQRVDVVVERLNRMLRERSDAGSSRR